MAVVSGVVLWGIAVAESVVNRGRTVTTEIAGLDPSTWMQKVERDHKTS